MLLRVKVEYISSYNEDGIYRKENGEFLLRADTFCTAEKAIISIIKERYHPKEESDIVVTAINHYIIEPDMKSHDNADAKWFEIHVKMKELDKSGIPKFKMYKYLKLAVDVTEAEEMISEDLRSGGLFDDFKVTKVIEMPFKEVIA
ncbi:MAG: DUF4494 family protein [Spirochaetales bacterium]|nr:DUF4494 family protein [Spirochaetales bacterium]